jgi:glycosyltransferase involved in cell wall biosynthesis
VAAESGLHNLLGTYRESLSKVVAPSQFFLEKFVEWGWPREQLRYIPNYVDASRFEPEFAPGDYFLYFGRMAPEKGVGTLLRAASRAGVKLKLAGTGPETGTLHALNAELGHVGEFLGFRSGADLHGLIKGARAVVLPSEWYENAPMSVLESFAFGKPVIGARIGGIPEMIEHGVSGWIFESGDVEGLGTMLSEVDVMSGSDIVRIGRSARALVEQRFNRAGYVSSMLTLYSELGVPRK